MSDETAAILRRQHAEAEAAEYALREAFFDAVGQAYQDPEQAVRNIAYALGRFGVGRTIDILERQPGRIGLPRGAWYTQDRYAAGGNERARLASEAIARLPRLARELGAAEEKARVAYSAHRRYCDQHGIEPDEPDPYAPDPAGTKKVPEHLRWGPEGAVRAVEPKGERDWWDRVEASLPAPPATPPSRDWWNVAAEPEPEARQPDRSLDRTRE